MLDYVGFYAFDDKKKFNNHHSIRKAMKYLVLLQVKFFMIKNLRIVIR